MEARPIFSSEPLKTHAIKFPGPSAQAIDFTNRSPLSRSLGRLGIELTSLPMASGQEGLRE